MGYIVIVHDSTGKLSSGILNGNINQHGDFDECLSIRKRLSSKIPSLNDHDTADEGNNDNEYDEIKGKYCLAYAQPILPHKSKRLQTFFKLVQSHGPFKSEFNDRFWFVSINSSVVINGNPELSILAQKSHFDDRDTMMILKRFELLYKMTNETEHHSKLIELLQFQ
ncbi:hypothetical protein GQX74_007481 [Glossina fuscipes]|nr:hypothetical protein GQX74_007481 [Glossina fuscipes]